MMWSISFVGHRDGTMSEQDIANVGRLIVEQLKLFGLRTAVFNGNDLNEDYLGGDNLLEL
jgi:hypothetical protein